jgi:branched-chain amino acid transport system ATP-binding protein
MLAMARALTTKPDVLLLDELSMGLAPLVVEALYKEVRRIAQSEIAIVIVEQFAHDVLAVADDAVVMSRDRIVLRGSPQDVTAGIDAAYPDLQSC